MEESFTHRWGFHLNKNIYNSDRSCPRWVPRNQHEKWQKLGLVLWDEDLCQIVNVTGGGALMILEHLETTDEWNESGITIGEPATRFVLNKPDQKSEQVLINQMHLESKQVIELLPYLRNHVAELSEIQKLQKKESERRLDQVYSLFIELGRKKINREQGSE